MTKKLFKTFKSKKRSLALFDSNCRTVFRWDMLLAMHTQSDILRAAFLADKKVMFYKKLEHVQGQIGLNCILKDASTACLIRRYIDIRYVISSAIITKITKGHS